MNTTLKDTSMESVGTCQFKYLCFSVILIVVLPFFALSDATAEGGKGVGPVSEVKLDEKVDLQLAGKGKSIFESKCAACHKFDEKYVGPALKGVTKKREPEWIMNMILNPQEMTQKDPVAQELFAEHLIQMTFQNVTEDDARAMLEYMRQVDSETK